MNKKENGLYGFLGQARGREMELAGTAAVRPVGAMISVLFAGPTLLTPLYLIYQHQWGIFGPHADADLRSVCRSAIWRRCLRSVGYRIGSRGGGRHFRPSG
jgi:hypothetical protein